MLDRIRLLPVLIVAAALLLGVKVERLWRHADGLGPVAPAQAAEDAEPAPEAEPAEPAAAPPQQGPAPTGDRRIAAYTAAELEVLQKLSARREQLEARAGELDLRENLLRAAEKRLDDKIGRLKDLEAQIQGLLKQHDEQTEAKLKSLVKMYETMKPKDAARIFEELDLDILLDVAERMREQKMAPILADMSPAKAKEVTVELARRRQLPETGG
jgi:flagellar motility protein MotE (MotC chaperone)